MTPRPPNRITATWRGGTRFEFGRPDRPHVLVDSDGEAGPGPVDTLLGACASCMATDVATIFGKQRTPPESMEIEVVGTRVDGTPRRLTHLLFVWRIRGGIERAAAERAVELSTTKYCSVRDSLDPRIAIEWRVELNGEVGPTRRAPDPPPLP